MGLEAACTVHVGRKSSAGAALLEGERLIFRGDFRLDIPFEGIRELAVDAGSLVVKTEEQEARFELGAPLAERWMRLIKEPKGLMEKLEITAQSRIAIVDVRDSMLLLSLRECAASVTEGRVPQGAATIFFAAESKDSLRKVQLLRARMSDTGVLWVLRPKGAKGISEKDVFEAVRACGLVDVKVVAVSKTHTAHKWVIPLELRGQGIPRPRFLSIPPSSPTLGSAHMAKKTAGKLSSRPDARAAAKSKAKKSPRD